MAFYFTPRQLDLELGLLLGDLHCKLHSVLGEERAALAFRFPPGRMARWEFLPEEIPVDEFPIHSDAHQLASYVLEQRDYAGVGTDIRNLELLTFWITDDLEEYWAEAHTAYPMEAAEGVTPQEEDVDEPFAYGVHYRGIVKGLIAHGTARLKVDGGERLTLSELALLAGHNERSVMSAAARGEFPSIVDGKRRLVLAADALAWLTPRGYVPTRKSGTSIAAAVAATPPTRGAPVEEMVFVPVARDGSVFTPDCSTSGGYTIGEKGDETRMLDYFQALTALAQMSTPRWRRPNAVGNRGIVAGVEWHRVSKRVLELAIAEKARGSRGQRDEPQA